MASLTEDLKNNNQEKYSMQEVKGGIKIVMRTVGEIGGLIGIALITFKFLAIASGVLAPLGIAVTLVMARLVLRSAFEGYVRASEEERRKIRAFTRWFNGGFSLGSFLMK